MILDGKDFSKEIRELDNFIDGLPTKEDKLITVLHKAQDLVGYLPTQLQSHVAKKLGVPSSKVYGVITFYSFFTTVPKGKYRINVCLGTACFVLGAQDIVNEFSKQLDVPVGGTSEDLKFSLDALRCVGACGLAPVLSINDKVYARVKAADVADIVAEYTEVEENA